MSSGSRALGLGLLAGAGGITLVLLAWLFVSGAQAGGIVLGLLLLLILAGPLAGGGWFVLSRQPAEQQAALAFERKRRVLDADQVFRAEVGDELRRLANTPALPGGQLRSLAGELQSPTHHGAAWQELVQLDSQQLDLLRRYDDLVWERVRRLRDGAQDPQSAIRELRQAVDQREDLLVRGRQAPGLAPSVLLEREAPSGGAALEQLDLGDAISYAAVDYVVESVASYFAEGQRWKLVRLAPTGAQTQAAWLYVGSGALDVAWLDQVRAPADDQAPADAGHAFELERSGTASVDVSSRSGTARGMLVAYRRYRAAGRLALVERWPDGVTHAYLGALIKVTDLEVWPAARA